MTAATVKAAHGSRLSGAVPAPTASAGAPARRTAGRRRVRAHLACRPCRSPPGILARGPWQADQVASRWREDPFEPPAARTEAADEAIAALADRGSPAHDGPRRAARRLPHRGGPARARAAADALVAAARPRGRVGLAGRAVRRARGRRPLAGRPARAVGRLVGRALGARRGRGGRGRRGPGRDARPRARRGVVGDPRAPDRRGARLRCPTGWRCWSASPGCPTASRSRPTPSTTRTPGGRRTRPTGRTEADEPLRRMASLLV